MSFGHNHVLRVLARSLYIQTDPTRYVVSINSSRVRHPEETYYIPDLAVIPVDLTTAYQDRWEALEVYTKPLALVVEIWSPSTGDYDIDDKIPDYMTRGDQEIWRIHPHDRLLTAWRRQGHGSYQVTEYTGGLIPVESLPGIAIDLDELFEE
jgi:Uma2 family endonuclease